MKKNFSILFLIFILFHNNTAFAEDYYFKNCKLNKNVEANYVINLNKKVIEVTLKSKNGEIQKLTDKIKLIKKDQIITEKIKSGKDKNVYFEYYLNAKKGKVIKLEYKKQADTDINIFKIKSKLESPCLNVKSGWDANKIKKTAVDKEQEQISKAQEKIKKEQSASDKCIGDDYTKWNNCKGTYISSTGHKFEGIFKNGEIIKGLALFPGGAKYVGDFKNNKPHGFGNFAWTNGDKYFGRWKNGKSHGNGTKIWNDGREYSGNFKNDKLHGLGIIYYPDGKKFEGEFINGKRHGEGTFTYTDGTAFVGKFIAGKQEGLGLCVNLDGSSIPCQSKIETQTQDFSGKDTHNISIVAKKWVRISQYETNTKKGKKIMDKLKSDFNIKAEEICSSSGNYNVLQKNIEVLDLDETPAYGLETKLKIGINGFIECK